MTTNSSENLYVSEAELLGTFAPATYPRAKGEELMKAFQALSAS